MLHAAVALLLSGLVATQAMTIPVSSACSKMFMSKQPIPFLFFADPGGFSGTAETKYILPHLMNYTLLSKSFPACGNVATGMLLKQRVAVVLTGIGPLNAGMCTQQVLGMCGGLVKFAISHGTSGWSAAVGGIITPPLNVNDSTTSCMKANPKALKPANVVRVGDLCVTPYAVNWACTQADWNQQCLSTPPGNLCFRPGNYFGPDADFLYGKCIYTGAPASSLALADTLMHVSKSARYLKNLPRKGDLLYAEEMKYWGLMSNGSNVKFPIFNQSAPPNVYDYNTCVEVDAQFFYSGVPWDVTARDMAALTINMVNQTKVRSNATALDVIVVSAMEAIGFAQAFEQYNALMMSSIPFTVLRANSDWLHVPIGNFGNGTWYDYGDYTSDFGTGYPYAIATYSTLTMTYMQNLCLTKHKAVDCSFKISYP